MSNRWSWYSESILIVKYVSSEIHSVYARFWRENTILLIIHEYCGLYDMSHG